MSYTLAKLTEISQLKEKLVLCHLSDGICFEIVLISDMLIQLLHKKDDQSITINKEQFILEEWAIVNNYDEDFEYYNL